MHKRKNDARLENSIVHISDHIVEQPKLLEPVYQSVYDVLNKKTSASNLPPFEERKE